MKITLLNSWFLSMFLIFFTPACGQKKNLTKDEATGGTTYTVSNSTHPHLAQSFYANTPNGLRSGTTLHLADSEAACDEKYTDAAEKMACKTIIDVQNRFFVAGPTVIRTRLSDLDSALNSMLERTSSAYVPCLDANRNTAATFPINIEGGTKDINYPAFELTPVLLKTTYTNGLTFDTGSSLQLSCFDANAQGTGGDAKTGIGTGYGFKDGKWYLYMLQSNSIAMFGSSDKEDSIDMWFTIGGTDPSANTANITSETSNYAGSTAVVHIISNPKNGLVGLSQVGVGVGPACGAQILMNNSTLFFSGNLNKYGQCTDKDFDNTGSGGSHNAAYDDVQICMMVSGSTVKPSADGLTSCVKSGLITFDADNKLVKPFAAAGLKNLTADLDSIVLGALKARAYMGIKFMLGTDLSNIPPFGWVNLGGNDFINIDGYDSYPFSFLRAEKTDSEANSLTSACNADASAMKKTITESFTLTVPDIIAAIKSNISNKSDSDILTSMTKGFANTGEASPVIEVPITGIKGTSFQGSFSGTTVVTIDGTTVGTGNLALPAADGTMMSTGKITLTSLPVLSSTSSIKIDLTGTLTLSCDNSNSTERTVLARAGVAKLTWFQKSEKK